MKKRIIVRLLVLAAAVVLTAFTTYRITMTNMEIEPTGDGRTAVVTVFGQSDLYELRGK